MLLINNYLTAVYLILKADVIQVVLDRDSNLNDANKQNKFCQNSSKLYNFIKERQTPTIFSNAKRQFNITSTFSDKIFVQVFFLKTFCVRFDKL